LAGKVLVIGEAHAVLRPELRVIGRIGGVRGLHGGAKARPAELGDALVRHPFGQIRHCLQHLPGQLDQGARAEAVSQRVNRLDQRHVLELVGLDHIVGVGDLLLALEEADRAGDVAGLAHRQELFDPAALGAEIHQLDFTGLVMREHPMRDVLSPARRRLVAVDMEFQRGDIVVHRVGDTIHATAVEDAGGHMHQQVERDGFLPLGRAEEPGQQRAELRPHPLDGVERTKQRIEGRRTGHATRVRTDLSGELWQNRLAIATGLQGSAARKRPSQRQSLVSLSTT
jgi:hypothetical protein